MTTKQRDDIESITHFIPKALKAVPITDADMERFLAYSERGEGYADKFSNADGFDALAQGKRWREWHMRAWEETVAEGTLPYYSLLFDDGALPRTVVSYMKRSMFGGRDAAIIEECYQLEPTT